LNYKVLLSIIFSIFLLLYIFTTNQNIVNIKKVDNIFSINLEAFSSNNINETEEIEITETEIKNN
jgi:hypothetical protein